jgi:hypothetical protein
MTLQVADNFRVPAATTSLVSVGTKFMQPDLQAILGGNLGPWTLSVMEELEDPLELDSTVIKPLILEFLTAQAVLAFEVRAASVVPRVALGRVVLVEYEPYKKQDPPIPLLCLLPLDAVAIVSHNIAINEFLTSGNAGRMQSAIRAVLDAGVGVMTRTEAFFYYTKMLSLATGAYRQRYDTLHVAGA